MLMILSTEGLLLEWKGPAVVKRSPRGGRGWDGAGGAITGLILDLIILIHLFFNSISMYLGL